MMVEAADAIARDAIAQQFVEKTKCSPHVPEVAKMVLERARLHNTYTSMPFVRDITFWVALQIAQKIVGGDTLVCNSHVLCIWREIRSKAPKISPWIFMQLELDMLQRTQWRLMPQCA